MEPNGQRAGPSISSAGSGLPSRVIVHGVPGVGKSTIGAFAPRPVFGMTRGETGLLTLIDNGLVKATPHFDEFMTWRDLLDAIDWLTTADHDFKTFVLDTLNGAERLCFESVCRARFNGDMERFVDFGKGPDIAQGEWLKLFVALDRMRSAKRMAIITLCHTRVKTFKNPEGDDYDRYSPELNDKSWGNADKWADIVLFANFESFAKKEKGAFKAKGHGGGNRILYTQRTAAYDAKNRAGLPHEISMGDQPADGMANFTAAMKAARQRMGVGVQVAEQTVATEPMLEMTAKGGA